MTYDPDDPRVRETRVERDTIRDRDRESGSFMPFVVGGLVVVALIFGILFYTGTFDGGVDTAGTDDTDVLVEEQTPAAGADAEADVDIAAPEADEGTTTGSIGTDDTPTGTGGDAGGIVGEDDATVTEVPIEEESAPAAPAQ